MDKKNILLTGAAGFIGAVTAKELIAQGYNVYCLDNMNDYYDVALKELRFKELEAMNIPFYREDIEDRVALANIFNKHKFDAVINLAARAGVKYSMKNPHIYVSTNVTGTLNLLEEMRKHNVKKLVLASTSSLYAGQKMPFLEELAVNTPISPYAASKKAAEMMCHSYHYLYDMDISVVRYFTVYGPAGRPDLCIFRFIKWIAEETPIELFGDGTQKRDFTYVTDIAKGTVAALKDVGYEIINLGGGKQPISLNYVISKIEEYLGKKAKIRNEKFHISDIQETRASIVKAEKLLGWSPSVDLDDGLLNCVKWYQDNCDLCKKVTLTCGAD